MSDKDRNAAAEGVENTEQPSQENVQVSPARYCVAYLYGLNLRKDPDKQSEILKILPCGTEVVAAGDSQQNGDVIWLPVDGGWVDSAYLRLAHPET